MEQDIVYTSYGECRCCLAKGHHRDVTKEYYFNNVREVYLDIFMDCFNLNLSTHHNISPLICSTCVQRLRDATSFRMMVASTERQLLQALVVDNKETVFINVTVPEESSDSNNTKDIKTELKTEIEDDSESSQQEQLDDSEEYGSDSLKGQEEYLVDGEAELLSRYPNAPPLPTRCTLLKICPNYVDHLNRLRDLRRLEAIRCRQKSNDAVKACAQDSSSPQKKTCSSQGLQGRFEKLFQCWINHLLRKAIDRYNSKSGISTKVYKQT